MSMHFCDTLHLKLIRSKYKADTLAQKMEIIHEAEMGLKEIKLDWKQL